MTIGSLLARAAKLLKSSASPSLDAEVLLAYVLGQPRTKVLTNIHQSLKPLKIGYFYWLVWLRLQGWPVAYLVGYKEFYGRIFKVNKSVLVPRPETELLIDKALGTIRSNDSLKEVADVGTGSGCIAVTLALEEPGLKIMATDLSSPALKLAYENSRSHRVADRIIFRCGDLLEPLRGQKIDVVVANLPYVTELEYQGNHDLKFEPKNALVNEPGLLTRFCRQLSDHPELKYVFLETSPQVLADWLTILKTYYATNMISVLPDLSGSWRLIMIDLN